MTKISKRSLTQELNNFLFSELARALALMETKAEIESFLRDLLTWTEMRMLSKRLGIARMLIEGEEYKLIKNRLKVTDATIARMQDKLRSNGVGLSLAVDRTKPVNRNFHYRSVLPSQVIAAQNFWKGLGKASIRQIKKTRKRLSARY
jgi:uncharacterized protein YerC